jgi:hypothetical protein
MQLKLKRSQRDTGVMSKTVVFCLDARVEFTPEERARLVKYKLHKQVIYNSEAAQKHLMNAGMAAATGSIVGGLKSLGSVAFAAMNLNISIETLEKGQHVECKSMDELLQAENAILTACENLKAYLDTAATFDGREVLFDFAGDAPAVVAHAAPQAALAAPSGGSGEAQAYHREVSYPDPSGAAVMRPPSNPFSAVDIWTKSLLPKNLQPMSMPITVVGLLAVLCVCTFFFAKMGIL